MAVVDKENIMRFRDRVQAVYDGTGAPLETLASPWPGWNAFEFLAFLNAAINSRSAGQVFLDPNAWLQIYRKSTKSIKDA